MSVRCQGHEVTDRTAAGVISGEGQGSKLATCLRVFAECYELAWGGEIQPLAGETALKYDPGQRCCRLRDAESSSYIE